MFPAPTVVPDDDLFGVSGKVCLVTGGGRGIGEVSQKLNKKAFCPNFISDVLPPSFYISGCFMKMIAEEYVRRGCRVIISSRKASACVATAQAINVKLSSIPGAGSCHAIPADIATNAGCVGLAEALQKSGK